MLGEPNKADTLPADTLQNSVEPQDTDELRSERAAVARWQKEIIADKEYFKGEFKRMRENMDFDAGIQWPGQKTIVHNQYIVNITKRVIEQRVAMLYAKNPRVAANRRPKSDFILWDGRMETMQEAVIQAVQMQSVGLPVPPNLMALFNDYQMGTMRRRQVEAVGKTLERVYHYQQQTQEPNFKTQMKQLVRRVCVTGVGYIKVSFCRSYEQELTHSDTHVSVVDRAKQARFILEKLEKGEIDAEDADVDTLRTLVGSLNAASTDAEAVTVSERLCFDFPQSTSIIPHRKCRALRGFIGANYVTEEFCYPLSYVNAFFEKKIDATTDLKYDEADKMVENARSWLKDGDNKDPEIRVWKVVDKRTKSTFTIAEGYKDYLEKPAPIEVPTRSFWQIFPVTFHDVEVEEGCQATIFPPSDVDLIRHPQLEHNRCREALRRHRKARRPRYLYPEGALDAADLDKIAAADDQEFIGLKSLQPGTEPGKVVQALDTQEIDPTVYDTAPIQEDALLATGQQEANMGPAQPNVTATVGTIAEQSRLSVATSDIDSLDDSLSDVAECGGEMLLREMSIDTVRQIDGNGAVWPEVNKQDFLNEINLEVVAASSGRPNKAVESANLERVVPLILQAATLPPHLQPTMHAIIRQLVKVLGDDRLDPTDFFPIPMPVMSSPAETANENPGKPRVSNGSDPSLGRTSPPKPRQLSEGGAVPLAGQPQNA